MDLRISDSGILVADKVDVHTSLIIPQYAGCSRKVRNTSLMRVRTKGEFYNRIFPIQNRLLSLIDMGGEPLYVIRADVLLAEIILEKGEVSEPIITLPEYFGVEDYDVEYTQNGKQNIKRGKYEW